tara:strand:- start:870 stop:1064 length:195 start_codon:yes stop_codon:yes gene_type:complete
MNTVFFTLMLVAMALTLVALVAGIVIMGKGGEANIKYGNKFMRARILLQGAALAFFALAVLTSV